MKYLFIALALLIGIAPPSYAASVVRSKSVVKICPSGSVIRPNQRCVIQPTQTCYNGTVILTTQTCPTQPSTYTLSGWTANAGSPAIWTITRTKGTVSESVEFKTVNGTAIAGTDYTGIDRIVDFAAGQATAQITIPTVIDASHYAGTLNFTASVTYKGNVVATAGSSIVEPAAPVTPSLTLSLSCAIGNAGTDVACTIGRSLADTDFSILFQTSDGTGVAGTDYTAVNQSIDFPVGVLTQVVEVHTIAGTGANKTFNGAVSYLTHNATGVGTIVEAAPAPPSSLIGVLDEGDSISYFWGGNHTGIYATNHPDVIYRGNAVGGSVLGDAAHLSDNSLYARRATDLAFNAKVLSILIGANDVPAVGSNWFEYTTPTAWFNALMAYVAPFRAAGTKVAVGTILPQCLTGNAESGSDLILNQNRAAINAMIRSAVGSQIDAVIDYAADPVMGPDAAACDTSLYQPGGLHPTDGATGGVGGQGKLALIYAPVIDALLNGATTDNPMTGRSLGVGAPDIATTDHSVSSDLQNSWGTGAIPASNSPDVVGAFRFTCRHTNTKYDDPTVYPNQPGASHLHDQTGVNEWSAFSNYVNLRTGGGGSGCNDVAGQDHNLSESTFSANRTPYWQPALLDGKGNMILVDYISLYYKRRPLTDPIVSDPNNAQYQGHAVKLPNGLKFIFGAFPGNSSANAVPNITYDCTNGAPGVEYANDGTFAGAIACAKAHGDGAFKVGMTGPDCWDGVHLDTPDHRSHLAYGSYGNWGYYKCDAGHPYVIPAYTYVAFYTVIPTDNGDIHWASDEMDNGKPRGWSFHVDYGPASWDPTVLQAWEDNCIDLLLNCSGGDLGNGKQLKGAAQPLYYSNGAWTSAWRNPQRLVPVPAHP